MAEKLFDNSYDSTELTKINIEPAKVFAYKEDELHHIRLQVQEYLDACNYDDYVFIKYKHKRLINEVAANEVFANIIEKFKHMLTLCELYSLMSEYFEINYIELYNLFSPGIQAKLKLELMQSHGFTANELNSKCTKSGLYMPGL